MLPALRVRGPDVDRLDSMPQPLPPSADDEQAPAAQGAADDKACPKDLRIAVTHPN